MIGATELDEAAQPGSPGIVLSSDGLGVVVPTRADDEERYFDDRDEDFDDWVCDRCHGDGADPWTDYMLPCPACQGEQRP
jgi:hypothetical protein